MQNWRCEVIVRIKCILPSCGGRCRSNRIHIGWQLFLPSLDMTYLCRHDISLPSHDVVLRSHDHDASPPAHINSLFFSNLSSPSLSSPHISPHHVRPRSPVSHR